MDKAKHLKNAEKLIKDLQKDLDSCDDTEEAREAPRSPT